MRHLRRPAEKIVVRILVPSSNAVLLERRFDELAAALRAREKRVKAVQLMFRDSLSGSDSTEYFVVITLAAAEPIHKSKSAHAPYPGMVVTRILSRDLD